MEMSVPENISKNYLDKMPPDYAATSLNLMSPESIMPVSELSKYIRITRESESGSEKRYLFHDGNNKLLYKSTLSQGSLSKCAKCEIQSTYEGAHDLISFDANSRMCCNGKWKTAELKNGTGAVIGLLEMRIPLHTDINYISEEGLAVSINNNNGETMFKIKMSSGPLPYRRRGESNVGVPYNFEVLSAAYGQRSVGKIFRSEPDYICCCPSTPRGYIFEYDLPLDSQTLSMILCGVMALETSFTDKERNVKYIFGGFGIGVLCFILIEIIVISSIL